MSEIHDEYDPAEPTAQEVFERSRDHYQNLYRETGSVVYVWKVMHLAIAAANEIGAVEGRVVAPEFPDWCIEYLHYVSGTVMAYADNPKENSATKCVSDVPLITGFAQEGKANSFKRYRSQETAQKFAYDQLVSGLRRESDHQRRERMKAVGIADPASDTGKKKVRRLMRAAKL